MTYIQVITTTETKEQAQAIVRHLVEEGLAACAQILDAVESTYRWKEKIETARETMCLIKTRNDLYPQVEAAIKKRHPYETPEIIALPILHGSDDYLKWLDGSLRRSL